MYSPFLDQLKFFKSQLNKYEDFIKEKKRYPNPTEADNIGLTQAGNQGDQRQEQADHDKTNSHP